jgi:hypothetical protein
MSARDVQEGSWASDYLGLIFCVCVWDASLLKMRQGASRQDREFSFLSAGSGWAWENSGEITRVDLRAFRVESRAPTQRLQLL